MPDPSPDERRTMRLAEALAYLAPESHGPAVQRIASRVVDDLAPAVVEDLLQLLERPALRQRLLEERLRNERFGPHPTTSSEGLTRGEVVPMQRRVQ